MQSDEREFDDPALRDAMRRAFGDEQAPPALRSKVSGLLQDGQPVRAPWVVVEPAARFSFSRAGFSGWWRRRQSSVYAAAAVLAVLIGIGVIVAEYNGAFEGNHFVIPEQVVADVPTAFGSALVTAHNRCAGMTDHHLTAQAAGDDLAQVHAALAAKTKFPIIATSPGEDWAFKGAGECAVAGNTSAHLLFVRGSTRVSIFSLPVGAMDNAVEGTFYQGTVDGVPVAGFVYAGGLHFVVASGGKEGSSGGGGGAPSLTEVVSMRDRMLAHCGASGCAGDILPPETLTQTASFDP